ncbi:MAG: M13 family metallopeptidase [Brevibacterium yomogidense]|uniref:Metallopeptidase n=1 Tax=Brevibacterium yomogidense TaxID=946573 RepID=A0A1X6WU97_9MICO|nr:M13-type metalloendopeptidase [Brevibacterium yomogidense]SLM88594.1 Metallopeptidase [Brevibacterium yomogidense]
MTTEQSTASADAPQIPTDIRPQDDLYLHVNGEWIASHTIPDDRSADGVIRGLFDIAEEKVRDIITHAAENTGSDAAAEEARKVADLFASFMDEDRVEELGVQPLEDDFAALEAAGDHDELVRVLGRLERSGSPGALAAYVSADAKDPEHYVLYVHQDGIGLPDESYYREDQHAEVRELYVAHLARMATLTGIDARTGRDAADIAQTVLDLETRFARDHWDVVETRDAQKTYNRMTIDEAAQLADGFDVRGWLTEVGAGDAPHVIVGEPSFLEGLGTVWAEASLDDLKVWAMLGTAHAFAAYLNSDVVEANFDFYGRSLSGTPQLRERWKRGVSLVESLLGEAVGRIYVAQEFPPSSKEAISELVDALIQAYDSSIRTLDWMGEETKERALEKLGLFTPKVGYPDVWREYTSEIRADDLVGNVRRATEAEHERQVKRIGQTIDRTEWLMTPQTVNAYFHPVMNEIVFPAAILQPPFFDPEASDAQNLGAIGAVIGHEIGHGFDDQGSRYDGHGTLSDWWTEEDRARFEEQTGSLIAQFDVLVPRGMADEDTVNGALTIGENIGDLGGLSIAWKALHLRAAERGVEVTEDDGRAFFESWARAWRTVMRDEERRRRLTIDPHSPEEFRCNQIVKNMDAFAQVYGTQEGDGMWMAPEERVSIW